MCSFAKFLEFYSKVTTENKCVAVCFSSSKQSKIFAKLLDRFHYMYDHLNISEFRKSSCGCQKTEKFLENENLTKFITFFSNNSESTSDSYSSYNCTDLRKSIYVLKPKKFKDNTFFMLPFCNGASSSTYKQLCAVTCIYTTATGPMYFVFCRLYPSSPQPPRHGSVWLLPVISLLLTSTVSPVRACLSI
jgi:hypothetical protein